MSGRYGKPGGYVPYQTSPPSGGAGAISGSSLVKGASRGQRYTVDVKATGYGKDAFSARLPGLRVSSGGDDTKSPYAPTPAKPDEYGRLPSKGPGDLDPLSIGAGWMRNDPGAITHPEGFSFDGSRKTGDGHKTLDGCRCCPTALTALQISGAIRELGSSLSGESGNWHVSDFGSRRADIARQLVTAIGDTRVRATSAAEITPDFWWKDAYRFLMVTSIASSSEESHARLRETVDRFLNDMDLTERITIPKLASLLQLVDNHVWNPREESARDSSFLGKRFAEAYLRASMRKLNEESHSSAGQNAFTSKSQRMGEPLRMNPLSLEFPSPLNTKSVTGKANDTVHILNFTLDHSNRKDLIDSVLEYLALRFCMEHESSQPLPALADKKLVYPNARERPNKFVALVFNDYQTRFTVPPLGKREWTRDEHDEFVNRGGPRLWEMLGLKLDPSRQSLSDIRNHIMTSKLSRFRDYYDTTWQPRARKPDGFVPCTIGTYTFPTGLQSVWMTDAPSSLQTATVPVAFSLGPRIAINRELFRFDLDTKAWVPLVNVGAIGTAGDVILPTLAATRVGRILQKKLAYSGADQWINDPSVDTAKVAESAADAQLSYRNAAMIASTSLSIVKLLQPPPTTQTGTRRGIFVVGELAHMTALAFLKIPGSPTLTRYPGISSAGMPSMLAASAAARDSNDAKSPPPPQIDEAAQRWLSQSLYQKLIAFDGGTFSKRIADAKDDLKLSDIIRSEPSCVFLGISWDKYATRSLAADVIDKGRIQQFGQAESELYKAAMLIDQVRRASRSGKLKSPVVFVIPLPGRHIAPSQSLSYPRVHRTPRGIPKGSSDPVETKDYVTGAAVPHIQFSDSSGREYDEHNHVVISFTSRFLSLLTNPPNVEPIPSAEPLQVFCQTYGPVTAAFIVIGTRDLTKSAFDANAFRKSLFAGNRQLWAHPQIFRNPALFEREKPMRGPGRKRDSGVSNNRRAVAAIPQQKPSGKRTGRKGNAPKGPGRQRRIDDAKKKRGNVQADSASGIIVPRSDARGSGDQIFNSSTGMDRTSYRSALMKGKSHKAPR